MNKEKITIKIADQTGFTISESDLSTGKIVVNGVEVTDTESWNKAISTFTELEYQLKQKDKEIERLNNIINKAIHYINLNQDEKTLCLNYNQLKALRGILKQDDFYLKIFEEQLKELKEGKDDNGNDN